MKQLILLSLFVLLVVGGGTAKAVVPYDHTDLGSLSSGLGEIPTSYAEGLSDNGKVTGWSYGETSPGSGTYEPHTFLWSGGTMTDLTVLSGYNFGAGYGVNNSGQVAGITTGVSGMGIAARCDSDGTVTDLGVLPDGELIAAGVGINNAGQVVGESSVSDQVGDVHAFSWSGSMISMARGTESGAFRVNNSGQAVGYFKDSSGYRRGSLWTDITSPMQKKTLNPAGSDLAATAVGINNDGDVIAGFSRTTLGLNNPVIWEDDGGGDWSGITTTQLDSLASLAGDTYDDFTFGMAMGVNDSDLVVGRSVGSEGVPGNYWYANQLATLWDEDGNVYNLNELVFGAISEWTLFNAVAINNNGQILCNGVLNDDYGKQYPKIRAFLLDPVPEPATICLLGLGGLALRKKRRA